MPSRIVLSKEPLQNIRTVQFVAWQGDGNVYDMPESFLTVAEREVVINVKSD